MYILNTRIWILNFATIWRKRLWNTFAIQLRGKGQTRSAATNGKCGINYVHYIWQRYFVCSPLLPKQLKNFSLCWWHCLPSLLLSLCHSLPHPHRLWQVIASANYGKQLKLSPWRWWQWWRHKQLKICSLCGRGRVC